MGVVLQCILNRSSLQAQRRIISSRNNLMSSSPVSELFPALGRDESIIVISFAPDIVALDIRLVAFSICAPLPDPFGYGFSAELGEVWFYRL